MHEIGCYMRYNYNLRLIKVNEEYPNEAHKTVDSSVNCADECHHNISCNSWSFQIATRLCFHFSNANTKMIHPEKNAGSLQQSSSEHYGWISGLKACKIFQGYILDIPESCVGNLFVPGLCHIHKII